MLYLEGNQLEGPIPPSWGSLFSLKGLGLRQNRLSGPIPPELGNLPRLQNLYLGQNRLSGKLPAELGNLPAVQVLDLSNNLLEGPVPAELGRFTTLSWLDLHGNALAGALPATLKNLSNLRYVDLSENHLYTDSRSLRAFLNARHPGGDFESTQTLYLYFPHFGRGEGLFSRLVLFNLNDEKEARVSIQVRSSTGAPLENVWHAGGGPGSHVIPPLGTLALQSGAEGSVEAGWVRVESDRHVEGVLIYGGRYGLAGVHGIRTGNGWAAPLPTAALAPGHGALAVCNPHGQAVRVRLTWQPAESPASEATISVPPLGHWARYLHEVEWGTPPTGAAELGVLAVNADLPIGCTLLTRAAGDLTALPLLEASSWQAATVGTAAETALFPQFAAGGGLLGRLLLWRPGESGAEVSLDLRADGGGILTHRLPPPWPAPDGVVNLAPGELRKLESGPGGQLVVGSLAATSQQPFWASTYLAGEGFGAAALAPTAAVPQGLVAPVRCDPGDAAGTGVAVMNPRAEPITVEIRLLDASGKQVASGRIPLASRGRRSLWLEEMPWSPGVPASFEGLIWIRGDGPLAAALIQAVPGRFVTLPAVPGPAP